MDEMSAQTRALAVCFEVVAADFGRRCHEAGAAGKPLAEVYERAKTFPNQVMSEVAINLDTYAGAVRAAESAAPRDEAVTLAARVSAWANELLCNTDAQLLP